MKNYVEAHGYVFESDDIEEVVLPSYLYYRMRGRKVTPLQAFDIISETEAFTESSSDFGMFTGKWLKEFPRIGIVRPDGYVGNSGVLGKAPLALFKVIEDVIKLKESFPYLNFIIAITNHSGKPEDVYKHCAEFRLYEFGLKYFEDSIIAGVLVTNKKIRILNADNAKIEYKLYNNCYACSNELVYYDDYYQLEEDLFPEGYISEVLKARGIADSFQDYYSKKGYSPYLVAKNVNVLPPVIKLCSQMVVTYKFLNVPDKFKAWIIAQFLYDAEELGYSIDEAWNLMVNSKVGKDFLSGKSFDMSASEADDELGYRYQKRAERILYSVVELVGDIQVLLDIHDGYGLKFEDAFQVEDYFTFKVTLGYPDVPYADIYSMLIGAKTKSEVLPWLSW